MRINDKENYNLIRESIDMSNLKKLMDSKGYSVVKIAVNTKVSTSSVNSYINAQKLPSVTALKSLADYLDTSCDYLIGRTDNPLSIDNLSKFSDPKINTLLNNILSLPKDKFDLIVELINSYTKSSNK